MMQPHAARMALRLRLGDDHLVLGHRLSQWCGRAPMLEEELALANTGLDLIGQARSLYSEFAELEGAGRNEDQVAYLRADREYHNLLLVERPNGDFAHTMVRQLYFSTYMHGYWSAAEGCADAELAAIAAKAVKEVRNHARHAGEWVIRLGDGSVESARRARAAVAALHPYTTEMFDTDAVSNTLSAAGLAPEPAALRAAWELQINTVFAEANLSMPEEGWPQRGGRDGRHGEAFGYLLAELQYMQRSYPGLAW